MAFRRFRKEKADSLYHAITFYVAKDQPLETVSQSWVAKYLSRVDLFRNAEWPQSSPDLNACEHMGAILMDRVEKRMQNTREQLLPALTHVLEEMEFERNLFVSLLDLYPARLDAVRSANGGVTKY